MKLSLTLDLPDWIPISVGQTAVNILHWLRTSATDQEVAVCFPVLQRLATDERMRNVWQQLEKRKRENYRSSDAYLHPAKYFPEVAVALKVDPQDRAGYQHEVMAALFNATFCLATRPLVIRKRSKIRPRWLINVEAVDRYDDIEIELPSNLSEIFPNVEMIDFVRKGKRDMQMGLWHVILCQHDVTLMVNRKTVRDARARCVGIGVAGLCEQWFGSALYGNTSKITQTATGKRVELSQIRQWCMEIEPIPQALSGTTR